MARGPDALGPRGQLASFCALFFLTVPLAAMSWHWLEKPLNDLKRQFPYVRGRETLSPALPAETAESSIRNLT